MLYYNITLIYHSVVPLQGQGYAWK